jgi:hypothetical protein
MAAPLRARPPGTPGAAGAPRVPGGPGDADNPLRGEAGAPAPAPPCGARKPPESLGR